MTKQNIFIFFIIPFFLQCSSVLQQNNSGKNNSSFSVEEEININKWKNATIHLEGATDNDSMWENLTKLNSGEISSEEYWISVGAERNIRNIRYQGSALFIEYNNKKYLVTARHVLHDTLEASKYLKYRLELKKDSTFPLANDDFNELKMDSENIIFNIIFRVPRLDEFLYEQDNLIRGENLMNLGAGAYFNQPYTFSEPELDLAVISLEADSRTKIFLIDLEKNGFKPIKIDSLSTKSIKEGDEIFCVGYPTTTSLTGKLKLPKYRAIWSSSYFSLPTVSFGRIAMVHQILPFYWGDMSVYPGNSGGPVIKNDNLIGIVSAQPILDKQKIPFAKIIKIEYLLDIIKQQQRKDNF